MSVRLTLWILCCYFWCISSINSKGTWQMVLPPDPERGNNLIDIIPYCNNDVCSVIVGYVTGDIFAVDLLTKEIVSYHLSKALQYYAPHSIPVDKTSVIVMDSNLVAIAVSGEQNMLYAADVDSGIWFMSLDPSSPYNTWQRYGPSAGSEVGIMLPLSDPSSSNILVAYSYGNQAVAKVDPFFPDGQATFGGYSSVVGTLATALFYTSTVFETTTGPYQEDYVVVGTNAGGGTLFVLRNGKSDSYNIGTSQGGIMPQVLNYKNGKNFWIICNVYDDDNVLNNKIWIYDLVNAGSQVATISTQAYHMLIYSDSKLNDWLIFTNSSGIYKTSMSTLTTTNPIIYSLASPFIVFHKYMKGELLQSYILGKDKNNQDISEPVLIVSSSKGSISMLKEGTTDWQMIASPVDIWNEGNEIQETKLVETTPNHFSFIAVLNDGAIIIQPDIMQNFTVGSASIEEDAAFFPAHEYDPDLAPYYTAPLHADLLSFNQIVNQVDLNNIIILTLADSTGNKVDFQIEGYYQNTNENRNDITNLKISMVNSTNTFTTMQNHQDLRFIFEIFEVLTLTYETLVWGLEVIEGIGEFVYVATEIYNEVTNLF